MELLGYFFLISIAILSSNINSKVIEDNSLTTSAVRSGQFVENTSISEGTAYQTTHKLNAAACTSDRDCGDREICDTFKLLCACKEGYEGEDCAVITGCKLGLEERCKQANATCIFKGSATNKATCECNEEDYVYDLEKCWPGCGSDSHCGDREICDAFKLRCMCKRGYEGEDCALITGCKLGLEEKCKHANATCIFDGNATNKASCQCNQEEYVYHLEECWPFCKYDTQCRDGGECHKVKRICICREGREGGRCEVVTGCKLLNETCKKANATCVFDYAAPNKARCYCNQAKHTYDPESKSCVPSCESDGDCGEGGSCYRRRDGNICVCKEGYEGGRCEVITGCKTLLDTCKKADATCVFDGAERNKANCHCNQDKYAYDSDLKICKKRRTVCDEDMVIEECQQKRATCVLDPYYAKGYRCMCETGFLEKNGICTGKTVCDDVGIIKRCQRITATCVVDSTSMEGYKCICEDGFLEINGICTGHSAADRDIRNIVVPNLVMSVITSVILLVFLICGGTYMAKTNEKLKSIQISRTGVL